MKSRHVHQTSGPQLFVTADREYSKMVCYFSTAEMKLPVETSDKVAACLKLPVCRVPTESGKVWKKNRHSPDLII